MIRYTGFDVVFQEVPGEVSLAFSISNCQGNCPGCHSPWLRENTGEDLETDLPVLLERYKGMATCVLFLGEGSDPDAIWDCIVIAKSHGYKTALYSGKDELSDVHRRLIYHGHLDYLKIGSYREDLGPLNSPTTNQRMIEIKYRDDGFGSLNDITHKFWKENAHV